MSDTPTGMPTRDAFGRVLRCLSYEGCRGQGWLYDLTDSGSGRQCYCDCPAGDELKRLDTKQVQPEARR